MRRIQAEFNLRINQLAALKEAQSLFIKAEYHQSLPNDRTFRRSITPLFELQKLIIKKSIEYCIDKGALVNLMYDIGTKNSNNLLSVIATVWMWLSSEEKEELKTEMQETNDAEIQKLLTNGGFPAKYYLALKICKSDAKSICSIINTVKSDYNIENVIHFTTDNCSTMLKVRRE